MAHRVMLKQSIDMKMDVRSEGAGMPKRFILPRHVQSVPPTGGVMPKSVAGDEFDKDGAPAPSKHAAASRGASTPRGLSMLSFPTPSPGRPVGPVPTGTQIPRKCVWCNLISGKIGTAGNNPREFWAWVSRMLPSSSYSSSSYRSCPGQRGMAGSTDGEAEEQVASARVWDRYSSNRIPQRTKSTGLHWRMALDNRLSGEYVIRA